MTDVFETKPKPKRSIRQLALGEKHKRERMRSATGRPKRAPEPEVADGDWFNSCKIFKMEVRAEDNSPITFYQTAEDVWHGWYEGPGYDSWNFAIVNDGSGSGWEWTLRRSSTAASRDEAMKAIGAYYAKANRKD